MTEVKTQRRGRAIAMTREEVDAFLAGERTCRVATVGSDGEPHVAPLWFVWDGEHVWLNSLVRSQRWTDLQRDPRVSLVVDAGVEFAVDGRHAWLRIDVEKLVSWDFRKAATKG